MTNKFLFACFVTLLLALATSTSHSQVVMAPINSVLLSEDECSPSSAQLSDDFDCDRVFVDGSDWSLLNPQAVAAKIEGGELVFDLLQREIWFNADAGVLLHRSVTGNFKASTQLRVHKTSNQGELPDGAVQLAGLMARDPASDAGDENYVFIVLGYDVNDISIETKNTIDSVSEFEGPSWEGGSAEIRICRVGDNFYTYKRLSAADEWAIADESNGIDWPMARPDLPSTLQLGLNIYTSRNDFDLSARFEHFTVGAASNLADCTTD